MQGPKAEGSAPGIVFLSYASQDAAAALRICQALRAGGVEVWFDQSELRGGDAWDQSIRAQLKACALFIPVISRNTHARHEGYFRLEWKLAVDRSHLIMSNHAFIVPVVIDDTDDSDPNVPERFRELQWTRLPQGETPPEFVRRVQHLLSNEQLQKPTVSRAPVPTARSSRRLAVAVAACLLVAGLTAYLAQRFWPAASIPKSNSSATASPHATPEATFSPPEHSVAVLPFVNMSGDPKQEYFSDGLTEEILDALTRVNQLQVAARTSAFSFKGKDADVAQIARKLNVGAVLEGSVRRSAHTVRVTAQLINAVTGFHIWSHTYDRAPGDALKLQTEIATAVAAALRVSLLRDVDAGSESGATSNPAAFDAYLRGKQIARTAFTEAEDKSAVAAFSEAIALDPSYALAYAERAIVLINYGTFNAVGEETQRYYERALADIRKAVALAPNLALGHYDLGALYDSQMKPAAATVEYQRALDLEPGNARFLVGYSRSAAANGKTADAVDAGRKAISLDPLNFQVYRGVGIALTDVRHYPEAVMAFKTAMSLEPGWVRMHVLLGDLYYKMGNYEQARIECEKVPDDPLGRVCLAMTYYRLGRRAESDALVQKLKSDFGNDAPITLAGIYAQRGDAVTALQWLDIAVRAHDSAIWLLRTDPNFDPLRADPRFKAMLSSLPQSS